MKKEQRHKVILNEVNIHNRVLLADLANILDVSVDTVRRDLKELDDLKKLKKVHGGAVSNGFNIYTDRKWETYEVDKKSTIVEKAISLINPGDVILMSGGSTNLELAKRIPQNMNLTFFTPSLPMAIELLNNVSFTDRVIFIGGELSKGSQLATGISTVNMISEIKTDICFLGTGYLHIDDGITENDWEIAQIKKAMIDSTQKLVSLTISKKLNTSNRYKICNIDLLDTLVTELDPDAKELEAYKQRKIDIL